MKKKFASQTAPKLSWKNAILLAVTAALALFASPGFAADTTWKYDITDDWFISTNWDSGVPGPSSDAFINNGGTAYISPDAPMAEALSLTLGLNAGDSGTVEVLPEHGDLTVGDAIFVGKGGKGNLTQTFGTIISATASIASQTGSSGSATVDGTTTAWRVSGEADVGGTTTAAGGTGLLTVTNSGTVSAASVHVWNSGTLTGTGTVSVNSGSGTVAVDGTVAPSGTLTITGNLSFGEGANMSCNVSSTTVDNAQLSGAAALDGKLSVILNGFFTGDFTLLHAGGGLGTTTFRSYSFTYTGCLSPSIVYDRTNGNVILHVVSTCN